MSTPTPPRFNAADIGPRCLVTGGAGYVGSALSQRLRAAGCQVRSLDLVAPADSKDIEVQIGDLRDPAQVNAACRDIDTIFHTAAIINLLSVYKPAERELVYGVNVTGTENLLRAGSAAGVRALIHTSSFNVVLDGVLNDCDEAVPYVEQPKDLYTQTKIAAERAVLAADTAGGLRCCALRPGGIWGPDTRSMMIKEFLTQLRAGNFSVLIGDGSATMDNSHVENIVDAQLLAARGLIRNPDTVGGQAYFITDAEPVNGLDWFRPLVEGLGHSFPRKRLPAGMMKMVGSAMEWAHYLGGPEPTLTKRGVRNLTESSSFRIDKARQQLGYEPRYQRSNGIPPLIPVAREFLERRT